VFYPKHFAGTFKQKIRKIKVRFFIPSGTSPIQGNLNKQGIFKKTLPSIFHLPQYLSKNQDHFQIML